MPDRTKLKSVASVEDTETAGHVEFHIRGRKFEIDELEAGPYESAIRAAATTDESGDPDGKTDMLLLEKLLVVDAVKIDGEKLDPEQWAKEKYPVYNRVVTEVKRLHWMDLETDEEADERKKISASAAREAAKRSASDVPNS